MSDIVEREDIVERLRRRSAGGVYDPILRAIAPDLHEAADEIEGLRWQMANDMVQISWDGLMHILDKVYMEDVFPTLPDDELRDPGPRIVSLLRQINAIRDELSASSSAS